VRCCFASVLIVSALSAFDHAAAGDQGPLYTQEQTAELSKRFQIYDNGFYFRWHVDRFRLFIGALRWHKMPAEIEEIVTAERLKAVLAEVRSKP
jgi:hypothetical protein